MLQHYCHECASKLSDFNLVAPSTLLAAPGDQYPTQFQFDKYLKHTLGTSTMQINSLFADPSWPKYQSYLISTLASGCLVISENGRYSMQFMASEKTGITYDPKTGFSSTCSGVAVVCANNSTEVHAYPYNFQFGEWGCKGCGKPIVPLIG
jgi:hypothetical protein